MKSVPAMDLVWGTAGGRGVWAAAVHVGAVSRETLSAAESVPTIPVRAELFSLFFLRL